MLDMAEASPADFVIDLGSGDGRTVITAARRGIPALGVSSTARSTKVVVSEAPQKVAESN